jgi:ActR/RegA family two-component response regulator
MNQTNHPAPGPPGKILFADDDEQFRLGLGKRLTRAGFACDFAGSAAEAIEALRTKDYDILLSDIHMPGNVGLELIQSIPAVNAGLPIILLTGYPTVETASRSVQLRITAYLSKPPDFEELCRLLHVAVAEHRNLRLLINSRHRLHEWDREIEHVQRLLQQPVVADREAAMQSYLRLTLRHLAVSLIELENLLIHEGGRLGADQVVEKQELRNAVRKTVGVLQKTKDHFKSRELGELRKELESVLARADIVKP